VRNREGIELTPRDFEEVISAIGDYRKKLDRESKVISDLVQDLVEYIGQDGSRRDKFEENRDLDGPQTGGGQ
jgi:hypothetical protein